MSNRAVKHSSRYSGPMGDSRPPAQIFAGIEAKSAEKAEARQKLEACVNEIINGAKHCSREGMIDMVKDYLIDLLQPVDKEG